VEEALAIVGSRFLDLDAGADGDISLTLRWISEILKGHFRMLFFRNRDV
jgi:hypothetical protein